MMIHRAWWPLPAWLLVAGLAAGGSSPASSDVCNFPVSVAVDTAQADTSVTAFLCRGYGQVFLATDTLIQSISIWRSAQPPLIDAAPRHLFITGTGTVPGDPRVYPDVEPVLLDAGPLVVLAGDGIHPIEYRWVFDPLFALPHRGHFFFDILASEHSSWGIPAVTTDPYPDGEAWETGPNFCEGPGPPRGFASPPYVDLVFEVRFCATGATPALPTSWGRLKVIYR